MKLCCNCKTLMYDSGVDEACRWSTVLYIHESSLHRGIQRNLDCKHPVSRGPITAHRQADKAADLEHEAW